MSLMTVFELVAVTLLEDTPSVMPRLLLADDRTIIKVLSLLLLEVVGDMTSLRDMLELS